MTNEEETIHLFPKNITSNIENNTNDYFNSNKEAQNNQDPDSSFQYLKTKGDFEYIDFADKKDNKSVTTPENKRKNYKKSNDNLSNMIEEENKIKNNIELTNIKLRRNQVEKLDFSDQEFNRTMFIYFVFIIASFSLLVFLFFYIHFGTYHVEVLVDEKGK
jgi:hypothetical protein